MLWLMGNRNKYAPLIGVANQILWFIYCIKTKQYGLLLGVAAYTIVHIRNSIKWLKKP
jgi:hypothetical protein